MPEAVSPPNSGSPAVLTGGNGFVCIKGKCMTYIINFMVTISRLMQEHVDSTIRRGMFRIAEETLHPA